jgi:hypothetical protein
LRRDLADRRALLDAWQSLPRRTVQPSVPVLYHRPEIIRRQWDASRASSASVRTWDWRIALVVAGIGLLAAARIWAEVMP